MCGVDTSIVLLAVICGVIVVIGGAVVAVLLGVIRERRKAALKDVTDVHGLVRFDGERIEA